mgnify:CR=1 FL=1
MPCMKLFSASISFGRAGGGSLIIADCRCGSVAAVGRLWIVLECVGQKRREEDGRYGGKNYVALDRRAKTTYRTYLNFPRMWRCTRVTDRHPTPFACSRSRVFTAGLPLQLPSHRYRQSRPPTSIPLGLVAIE